MKVTLSTCALGALGLTPALMGTQQQELNPPTHPIASSAVDPTAPRAFTEVKLTRPMLKSSPPAPVHAPVAWRLAPAAQDDEDLKRAAAKLEKQVAQLQAELEAMHGALQAQRQSGSAQRQERAEELRQEARERAEEARERASQVRERASEVRERAQEVREEARVIRGRVARPRTQERTIVRLTEEAHGHESEHEGEHSGDRHIQSHGPSTFNIHLEDGDVHIHAHGPSNFNTGAASGSAQGKAKVKVRRFFSDDAGDEGSDESSDEGSDEGERFGIVSRGKAFTGDGGTFQLNVKPDQGHQLRFFAHVDSDNEDENEFELEINGRSIDLEDIGEVVIDSLMDGKLNFDVEKLEGLGGLLDNIEGLENLNGIHVLQGLEGLEGLEGLQGLEGLGGILGGFEGLEDLEDAFEGLDGFEGVFRFEMDDDECDEEIEEEEEFIIEEAEADGRELVVKGQSFPNKVRSPFVVSGQRSLPVARGFPSFATPANLELAGQPLSPEQELLELTREIHAEVQAMRAELDELRSEVLTAPVKVKGSQKPQAPRQVFSFSETLR